MKNQAASQLGKLSWKARTKGLTKEQISELMKRVKAGKKIKEDVK